MTAKKKPYEVASAGPTPAWLPDLSKFTPEYMQNLMIAVALVKAGILDHMVNPPLNQPVYEPEPTTSLGPLPK